MSSFGQCSICQFNFSINDMAFLRTCKHAFCYSCITNWVQKLEMRLRRESGSDSCNAVRGNKKPTTPSCPYCRTGCAITDITKWEPGMDISMLFVQEPEKKPEHYNPNGGKAEVFGLVTEKLLESPDADDALREFQHVTKVCKEYLGGDDPAACAQIDKLAWLVEPMVTGKPSEEEKESFWSKIWRFIHYAGIKLRTIVAFLVYCFVFVAQLVGKFLKMLADLFASLWDKLCTFGSWILSVLADVRHRVFG